MLRILLCLLISFLILPVQALDKMFASLGNQANISSPGSFQDQAAGYYTGGGFMLRTKNKTLTPLQVSLPHIGAGCRGIDAYFGGFSFMKSEQLIRLLRTMGTQAGTYAFQLALKTMAPQVENLFSQLRTMALKANALMLEDCRMVQSLYASALPKNTAMQEQACIDVRKTGDGEDWFGAKQKCVANSHLQQAAQQKKQQSPDLLIGEYNLVWDVAQKIPELKERTDLCEFIMSITGTLISKKEGDRYRIRFVEGKADDRGFVGTYLKGGSTEKLRCRTRKCLAPKWTPVTIGAGDEQTMIAKVEARIASVYAKYQSKEELSSEEIAFLNDTVKVPVYRYIQVSAASGSFPILNDALEYIALSVLLTQFDTIASKILSALDSLQEVQMDDTQIKRFTKALQQTRVRLHQLIAAADHGAVWRLNRMIQAYEQSVMTQGG